MAAKSLARLIAINFILVGLILAPPYFFGSVALRVGVELAAAVFLGGWLVNKLWRGEGLRATLLDWLIGAVAASAAFSVRPRLSLDSLFFIAALTLAYYFLVDTMRHPGMRAMWSDAVLRLGVVLGLVGLILAPPYFFGPVAPRVGVELAVGLFLGGWLVNKLWRRESLPATPLDWPIGAVLLASAASAFFSVDPRLSLDSLFFIAALTLAYYFLVDTMRHPGMRAMWSEGVLRLGVVLGVVGLVTTLDWYFGLGLWWPSPGWWDIGGPADPIPPTRLRSGIGPLVWPTIAAVYLGFALAFAGGKFLAAASPGERKAGLISLALVGLGLLLTYTRGAWLGAGAMAAVLGLALWPGAGGQALSSPRLGGTSQRPWRRWLTLLAVGLAVAVGLASWALEGLKGRQYASDLLRLELARAAWAAFAERPLFGGGLGTFGQLLLQGHWSPFVDVVRDHAHNAYLNILAEQGLVGTGAAVWLGAAFIGVCWRGWGTWGPGLARAAYLAPIAALAGLAAHSLFDSFTHVPGVMFYAIMAAALAVANAGPVAPRRGRLVPALALAAWGGVLALTLWSEAAAYQQEQGLAAARKGDWQGAIAHLERARALDPGFGLYSQQLGLAYGQLAAQAPGKGWEGRALEHLRRGMEAEGNYGRNWAHLGLLLLQAGEKEGALAALRRAAELDPADYRYFVALGRYQEEAGAQEEALAAYAQAMAVAPDIYPSAFWQGSAFRQENIEVIYRRALAATEALPPRLVRLHRGRLAHLAGDYQRALAEYEGASELGLGRVYFALGRWPEALAHYDRALRREKNLEGYAARAQVYLAQGRLKEAERDLWTALFVSRDNLMATNPAASWGHYYLGQVREAQGDLPRAIAEYSRGLPAQWVWTYYEPYVWRRPALFPPELPQLGELAILRATPGWKAPFFALAAAYEKAGRMAGARRLYGEILRADPTDAIAAAKAGE